MPESSHLPSDKSACGKCGGTGAYLPGNPRLPCDDCPACDGSGVVSDAALHRRTTVDRCPKHPTMDAGCEGCQRELREALALARSMVLSGESMTPQAQAKIDGALNA